MRPNPRYFAAPATGFRKMDAACVLFLPVTQRRTYSTALPTQPPRNSHSPGILRLRQGPRAGACPRRPTSGWSGAPASPPTVRARPGRLGGSSAFPIANCFCVALLYGGGGGAVNSQNRRLPARAVPLKHIGKPQPGETVFVSGAGSRVISDCHFSVQFDHFIPGFLSYSVATFLK
jgi:hypothetical protein